MRVRVIITVCSNLDWNRVIQVGKRDGRRRVELSGHGDKKGEREREREGELTEM